MKYPIGNPYLNSRDLNILELPESIKIAFQKRIDEISAGLHRRFEALPIDKVDSSEIDHINLLFCFFDCYGNDFVNGFDMNFGCWQDEVESCYNEIIHALQDAEETVKTKGGEPK